MIAANMIDSAMAPPELSEGGVKCAAAAGEINIPASCYRFAGAIPRWLSNASKSTPEFQPHPDHGNGVQEMVV